MVDNFEEFKDDFEKELQELSKQHRTNMHDGLVSLKMQQFKVEKKFIDYVISDIIDSYNKLMEQRKECIEKHTNFFKLFDNVGKDIGIVYKYLYETKEVEFDVWKKEVKFFVDIQKENAESTEKEMEEYVRSIFDE